MDRLVGKSITAEQPKESAGAVVLKSRPGSAKTSAYAQFLGAVNGGGKLPARPQEVEEADESEDDSQQELIPLPSTGAKPQSPARSTLAIKMSDEEERANAIAVRRAWLEREEAQDGDEARVTRRAAAAPTRDQPGGLAVGEFIAAASFGGAKPGYAFKSGPKGMGYYLDAAQQSATPSAGGGAAAGGDADGTDDVAAAAALRAAMTTSAISSSLPSKLALRTSSGSLEAAEAAWAATPSGDGFGIRANEPIALDISEPEAAASPVTANSSTPARAHAADQLRSPPQQPRTRPEQPRSPVTSPKQLPVLAVARALPVPGSPQSRPMVTSTGAGNHVAPASVVEFGSMKVTDDDDSDSSSANDDEEEDNWVDGPVTPPAKGRARTVARPGGSRYVGGDDSDGEIEYG